MTIEYDSLSELTPKASRSGKKPKTPEPEPEPEPEVPPGTPPPAPGSDEWEYVNQPLEQVHRKARGHSIGI